MSPSRSVLALAAVLLVAAPLAVRAQPAPAPAAPNAPAAAAQDAPTQAVETTGMAAILGNDRAAARERAIEDALRQAVEQVAGTMVSSTSLVQNSMLMEDSIFSQARGYVRSYEIASEQENRGVFEVRVRAQVSTANLSGDIDRIRAQLERIEYPRVMVMMSEQNISQQAQSFNQGITAVATSMGVVENELIGCLNQAGFPIVDRQALAGRIRQSPALSVISAGSPLSAEQIEELANLSDAQIIVYGQAVANAAGNVMNTQMISSRANISARVINADNGQILATETREAGSAHIDATTAGSLAMRRAARELCTGLQEQLVERWARSTQMVTLEVEGIRNMAMLAELKNVLRSEVRGVQAVRERSFQQAKVVLDVEFAGRSTFLAHELENRPFERLTIRVLSRTANRLTLSVALK